MRKLIITTLLLSMATLLLSQDQSINSEPKIFWFDVGSGLFVGSDNTFGLQFPQHISINIKRNKNNIYYKLTFLKNNEFWPSSYILPEEEFSSFGVQLGKGFSWKRFQLQFFGGLGFTTGVKRGDFLYSRSFLWSSTDYYEEDKFFTPSIPVTIDMMFIPTKYTGIGIALFGDLNFRLPYCGLTLKLSLGKLR